MLKYKDISDYGRNVKKKLYISECENHRSNHMININKHLFVHHNRIAKNQYNMQTGKFVSCGGMGYNTCTTWVHVYWG